MGDPSRLEQKISYAFFARLGLLVTSEGRKFTDSDILHLDVVDTSIIVLDSAKADLLEKRSSLHSNRFDSAHPKH